jgi:hypothetical protein
MSYDIGHVMPWWNDDFKKLDYIRYPLTNGYDINRWRGEGYANETFGGLVYNMTRKMPEDSDGFFTLFDWKDVAISYYLMLTNDILPLHQDQYPGYTLRNNIKDINSVKKAVVFLEDWQSGHYFEIDNHAIINWKAGDWVSWSGDCPHMAANIGIEPRYTLQITGHE